MSTIHIDALTSDIAPLVLMPGDPDRCAYIASTFLTDARLINTSRGEDAYTGFYKGKRVTVFPSGMGIPSMGIYSYELFDHYNVETIIRIGTCGSYDDKISLRDLVLASSSYSKTSFDEESTSSSIDIINSSFDLNSCIISTAEELNIDIKEIRVHTSLAFYTANEKIDTKALEKGCSAVEMESFALFLNAKKFHKQASCILTVTDNLNNHKSLSREERVTRLNTMITLSLESIIKN